MFHGLLPVLHITHAHIVFVVGIDSIKDGAKGLQYQIIASFLHRADVSWPITGIAHMHTFIQGVSNKFDTFIKYF